MAPWVDRFLVNVSRLAEEEPGFRLTVALSDSPGEVVTSTAPVPGAVEPVEGQAGAVEPTAYLEPRARRWMGKPSPVPAFAGTPADPDDPVGTPAVPAADSWAAVGTALRDIGPRDLLGLAEGTADPDAPGFGVEVAQAAAVSGDPWRITTVDGLEPGRGLLIGLYPYEPDDWADAAAPLRVIVGDRFRLDFTPTETGAASVMVYQRSADDSTAWAARARQVTLIDGDFYNRAHRIWLQPLGDDELLIGAFDDQALGRVVPIDLPIEYVPTHDEAGIDVPDGTDPAELEPAPAVSLPWAAEPLIVEGFHRVGVVVGYMVHPAAWALSSPSPIDLGYETSTQPAITSREHIPPIPGPNGTYAVALSITTAEGESFGGDPASAFRWAIDVTGPADFTFGGRDYAARAVVIDQIRVAWDTTLADDGAIAVDLSARTDIGIDAITESRGDDDGTATLSLDVMGPKADVEPWVKPNSRWQWLCDDAVRFDGLRDRCASQVFRSADGVYMLRASVTLRNRWRQLDNAIYRGSIPLDGQTRSEAYATLASMAPFDATEVDVGALANDNPLPSTKPGDAAAFQPRPGTSIAQVIRDLQQAFGADDRIRFLGEVFTVEPAPDPLVDVPSVVFYRNADDVPAQPAEGEEGAWDSTLQHLTIGGPDALGAFVDVTDDSLFVNDLWVIGRDPSSPRDNPSPIVAYMIDPDSWKASGSGSSHYVGMRRTAVVFRPELTTAAAVEDVCRNLWRRFHRFVYQADIQSVFAPSVYPGDLVAVHPGADPTADYVLAEVVGMTTRLLGWAAPTPWRWATTYTLRRVNDAWAPPTEGGDA